MGDFFQKIKAAAGTAAEATEKAAKNASESAKKMAEKSRIKREISTLEAKLSADFREIGQQFYNDNVGAPDEKYATLFAAIEDSQKAIAEKQDELAQVDNSRPCPSCGNRLKLDALFCSQCGAKLEPIAPAEAPAAAAAAPAPAAEAPIACPGCGASVQPSAMFCPECGKNLAAHQPEVIDTPADEKPTL